MAPLAKSNGSARVERGGQPLDPIAVDRDDVEAARRRRRKATQIVGRREDEPPSLRRADRRRGAAEAIVAAPAHLDEDERSVALAHDEVDFAAARARAARDPIIAPHQHQPGRLEMGERARFGGVAERLRCRRVRR